VHIPTITGGKPITMAIDALFGFGTDIGPVMAMTMVSLVPGAMMIYFVRNQIAAASPSAADQEAARSVRMVMMWSAIHMALHTSLH
jgi:hypothetical protein